MEAEKEDGRAWREVIEMIMKYNAPRTCRQDHFTRYPTLQECENLVDVGIEKRVASAYVGIAVLEPFKKLKWSPLVVKTLFAFVARLASECRRGSANTGRLSTSNTAAFWREYSLLADEEAFQSDLRNYWRLLVKQNENICVFNQKLLSLEVRLRITSELRDEVLPAFTMLYCEILLECLVHRLVPRRNRVSYRFFVMCYKYVDFFASPTCHCCLSRMCTADILDVVPDQWWPALDNDRWTQMIKGRFCPPADSFKLQDFTDAEAMYKCMALSLGDLGATNTSSLRGDLRKQVVYECLQESIKRSFEMVMRQLDKDELSSNDFMIQDIDVVGKHLGINAMDIYKQHGWQPLWDCLQKRMLKANSWKVNFLACQVVSDFVCNTDFSFEDSHPQTLAQQFWVQMYDLLQTASTAENSISPRSITDPAQQVSPLVCHWMRLSIDMCVNKVFTTGDLARIEALMTRIGAYILNRSRLIWAGDFHESVRGLLDWAEKIDITQPVQPT